jgi:hypothetical protein
MGATRSDVLIVEHPPCQPCVMENKFILKSI